MKKISTLILLSLTLIFIFSCKKAESPVNDSTKETITTLTVAAPDTNTKVSFEDEDNNGMKLTWEVDDIITIYSQDGNYLANYKCKEVSEQEATKGEATFTFESGTALDLGTTYQAVYPASDKTTIAERNAAMTETLANQTQTEYDLTHLDNYLFMESSFTTDNKGIANLNFTYQVSTYILTFPALEGENTTAVELKDDMQKLYKLTTNVEGGFAGNKAYFMIAAYTPDLSERAKRPMSFKVSGATISKYFNVASSKTFDAGHTYHGNILAYNNIYIDENGMSRGEGITLLKHTWAPVNLGYEQENGDYYGYPYGKLYQWGRKDGQGYSSGLYDDATYPNLVADQTSEPEKDKFYYFEGDWTTDSWTENGNINAWNEWNPISGTFKDKVGNPCPPGWRVPTKEELGTLEKLFTGWSVTDEHTGPNGEKQIGRYFSNVNTKMFLPSAGYRNYDSIASDRDSDGYYWSSTPDSEGYAYRFYFSSTNMGVQNRYRSLGCSVRCIQD